MHRAQVALSSLRPRHAGIVVPPAQLAFALCEPVDAAPGLLRDVVRRVQLQGRPNLAAGGVRRQIPGGGFGMDGGCREKWQKEQKRAERHGSSLARSDKKRTIDLQSGDSSVDERLRFGLDLLEVRVALEAFRVNFVDIFGPAWPCREPAFVRGHLQATDRRVITRRLGQDGGDPVARKSRSPSPGSASSLPSLLFCSLVAAASMR